MTRGNAIEWVNNSFIEGIMELSDGDKAESIEALINRIYKDFKKELREAYRQGHKDGWKNSGEGYNSEYGCEDDNYKVDLIEDLSKWESTQQQ